MDQYQGRRKVGAWGALAPPQCLAKQLTLSQPGGQIMPAKVLRAPPNFQTLRRPWSVSYRKGMLVMQCVEMHRNPCEFKNIAENESFKQCNV